MDLAAEKSALITLIVVGLSHLFQSRAWVAYFNALYQLGKPGALINGATSLAPGAVFICLRSTSGLAATMLQVFGWLLVAKGTIYLLMPDLAIYSMSQLQRSDGRELRIGGILMLVFAALLGYAIWTTQKVAT